MDAVYYRRRWWNGNFLNSDTWFRIVTAAVAAPNNEAFTDRMDSFVWDWIRHCLIQVNLITCGPRPAVSPELNDYRADQFTECEETRWRSVPIAANPFQREQPPVPFELAHRRERRSRQPARPLRKAKSAASPRMWRAR